MKFRDENGKIVEYRSANGIELYNRRLRIQERTNNATVFIAIILVLGLGSYYLYNQNETLKANNQKLEYAIEEQTKALETLRESYERQGQSLMNMSRRNAEIEGESEYLAIFSRHNLDMLALKK